MSIKLPSITDEIRTPVKKLALNLRSREEVPDDAIEASSRALGEKWGSSTHLTARESAPPPKPTTPLVSVRFDAPDYLDRELSVRAAEQGVTKTYLILQALGQGGFRIESEDLVKDRRRWKASKQ